MERYRIMSKLVRPLLLLPAAVLSVGTAPRSHELDSTYSFDEYLQHFDKSYPDAVEYRRRKERFTQNIEKILNHNKGRLSDTGEILDGGYVMGVNHLTDQHPDELPFGYDKTRHSSWSGQLMKGASKIERRLDESATTSYSVSRDATSDVIASCWKWGKGYCVFRCHCMYRIRNPENSPQLNCLEATARLRNEGGLVAARLN